MISEPTKITVAFDLEPTVVSEYLGNGLRMIAADRAEVTFYRTFEGTHVVLTGCAIRRDGTQGARRQLGWSVGPKYSARDEVPMIVRELIDAADEVLTER